MNSRFNSLCRLKRKSNKEASTSSKRKRNKRSHDDDGFNFITTPVVATTMKRKRDKAFSSTFKRKKMRCLDDLEFEEMMMLSSQDLECMSLLSSIDDAFHLSWKKIYEVKELIQSHRSPPRKQFMNWDVYVKSFYLKMLSCCENKSPLRYDSLDKEQEEHMDRAQPLTEEISPEEKDSDSDSDSYEGFSMPELRGPFQFGSYSFGTAPVRIPYHLYMLVNKAVDIMKRSEGHDNLDDQEDLTMVEEKIRFFCKYFYSHLPNGWKYNRDTASDDVASYDPFHEPKYNMDGYTPISHTISDQFDEFEYDEETGLSRQEMIAVMCIIHSRWTPAIWKMSKQRTSFYCKICSCFGIDYHRLEAASKDDVCLMNVGRKGVSPWD